MTQCRFFFENRPKNEGKMKNYSSTVEFQFVCEFSRSTSPPRGYQVDDLPRVRSRWRGIGPADWIKTFDDLDVGFSGITFFLLSDLNELEIRWRYNIYLIACRSSGSYLSSEGEKVGGQGSPNMTIFENIEK